MTTRTMRALLCEEHGPPEKLRIRNVPVPAPDKGEVLIKMHTAGVNFPDSLIVADKYQIKPSLPFSPGGELAGTIAAIGADVTGFAMGDRVAALTKFGAFAEYALADASHVSQIPATVDLTDAGVLTFTYGTIYHCFRRRIELRGDETVLVLGAGGGIGLAAVQFAAAIGATVIAAASSEPKLQAAEAAGAAYRINYAEQDLRAAIKEIAPEGVNAVLDPVGGRFAEPAFRALAWEGQYLVVGFAGGEIPRLPLNLPLVKGASLHGVFWGDFVRRNPIKHAEDMKALFGMLSDEILIPRISRRFELDQGAEAVRQIATGQFVGKALVYNDRWE